jgi:hypothetical protein
MMIDLFLPKLGHKMAPGLLQTVQTNIANGSNLLITVSCGR